jgi:hypothetical protein
MSIRVKTEDFVQQLSRTAALQIIQATEDGVVDGNGANAHLDPFVRSVFERHQKNGKMKAADLVNAFEAEARALSLEAAGVGRSANWISRKKAKTLPKPIPNAYDIARKDELERRSQSEPFPGGTFEPNAFFKTFLPTAQARQGERIIELGEVIAELPKLAALEAPAVLGGVTVRPVTADPFVKIGNRSFYTYSSSPAKLAFQKGDVVVIASWGPPPGADDGIGKVDFVRFHLGAPHSDPAGTSAYTPPGSSWREGFLQRSLDALESADDESHPVRRIRTVLASVPEEPRFAGTDFEGLALVAKATAAHAGKNVAGTINLAVNRAHEPLQTHAAEVLARANMVKHYRAIAERVEKAGGEIMLGDADTYLRIADKFVKEGDEDEGEPDTILAESTGPLLIVDNHFGGLGHAVSLDKLAKGDLEIFVSHENERRGKVVVTGGKLKSMPDAVMFERVVRDVLEYLSDSPR